MEKDERLVAVYVANLDVNLIVDKKYSIQFGSETAGEWGEGEILGAVYSVVKVNEFEGEDEGDAYWGLDQALYPTLTTIVKFGGLGWGVRRDKTNPWMRMDMTLDEVLALLRGDLKDERFEE